MESAGRLMPLRRPRRRRAAASAPPELPASPPPGRGIYANRTLNLRSIRAIGYDMDYTLIHYDMIAWERRAYAHLRAGLAELGWPVQELTFDPGMVIRGLAIDVELGNLVKPNRFGYGNISSGKLN